MIEVYEFLSLHAKQKGEGYQTHLEAIEKAIQEKNRWSSQKLLPMENRFLKAHVHYISGSRALKKTEFQKGVQELKLAADLVPEDAVTAYALAESYAKLGNVQQADFYRGKAKEAERCLE